VALQVRVGLPSSKAMGVSLCSQVIRHVQILLAEPLRLFVGRVSASFSCEHLTGTQGIME